MSCCYLLVLFAQGALVRLGRLRWGPEIEGGPDGPDSDFLERDVYLSLALADMFEV